jgi:superfamily II DNA or RNA helicase
VSLAIELRDYQLETIGKVEAALAEVRAVILQAPCGSGKTVMAAELIRRAVDRSEQVLFLAHRRELIFQCADKLGRFGIDYSIMIAGEKPSLIPDVVVASIQTLTLRISRGRVDPPRADLIILDECHHAVAKTHLKLIDGYPSAKIVGLTATPIRGDGKGLGVTA